MYWLNLLFYLFIYLFSLLTNVINAILGVCICYHTVAQLRSSRVWLDLNIVRLKLGEL